MRTVLLLLALVITLVTCQCNYTNLVTSTTNYFSYLSNLTLLNDPFLISSNPYPDFATYSSTMQSCQFFINSLTVSQQVPKVVFTDECLVQNNSDPCCNINLKQCCMARTQNITVTRQVLAPNAVCSVPAQAVNDFLNLAGRLQRLQSATFTQNNYLESRAGNSIMQCAYTFATPTYCGTSDAACPISGVCNRNTSYCELPSDLRANFYKLLAHCIAGNGELANVVMKKALSIPLTATLNDVADALKSRFEQQQGTCMRAALTYNGEPTPLTQNSCDNFNRKCTDNTNPPCGQFKCMACNGFSPTCNVLPVYADANNCSSTRFCLAGSSISYVSTDVCMNSSRCNNFQCSSVANAINDANTCTSNGYCSYGSSCSPVCAANAATFSACNGLSRTVNNLYISCTYNFVALACFCQALGSQITPAQCNAVNGNIVNFGNVTACGNVAKTCSYRRMNGAQTANDLSTDECNKCNGTLIGKYSFTANTWNTAVPYDSYAWRQTTNWTELFWMTPGFNYATYKQFVRNAFVPYLREQTLAYFRTLINARAEFFKRLICNCNGGSNCFAPIKSMLLKINTICSKIGHLGGHKP